VLIFIWVFFDALYCSNFDWRRAQDYAAAGYDVDFVHHELLSEHYSGFLRKAIDAIADDVRAFSY